MEMFDIQNDEMRITIAHSHVAQLQETGNFTFQEAITKFRIKSKKILQIPRADTAMTSIVGTIDGEWTQRSYFS